MLTCGTSVSRNFRMVARGSLFEKLSTSGTPPLIQSAITFGLSSLEASPYGMLPSGWHPLYGSVKPVDMLTIKCINYQTSLRRVNFLQRRISKQWHKLFDYLSPKNWANTYGKTGMSTIMERTKRKQLNLISKYSMP
jgi:hypothetical protein